MSFQPFFGRAFFNILGNAGSLLVFPTFRQHFGNKYRHEKALVKKVLDWSNNRKSVIAQALALG